MATRRPVDRKIRLLAINEYNLMDMLEREIAELEGRGHTIKMVTTNPIGTGYTAEVVYHEK